jgi:hypothetical protein
MVDRHDLHCALRARRTFAIPRSAAGNYRTSSFAAAIVEASAAKSGQTRRPQTVLLHVLDRPREQKKGAGAPAPLVVASADMHEIAPELTDRAEPIALRAKRRLADCLGTH